ncbi:MAG: hypothetical protein HC796_06970 [Synechococcaceae cyanobacterium RL_1_2]|nr:hypothetical protein [Synechococcaceae cyanobacterium RL_1_2]
MQPHVKTFCRRWLFSLAIALLLLTSLQSFAPAQNNPEPMEDGGNLSAPTTVIVEPETTGAIAIEGVPVVLGDQELFYIQAKIASFSPEFRAKVISQRLITFAKTMEIEPDQLTIVNNEATQTTDIMAGEVTLVTIADVDAVAAGQSRQVLGRLYLEAIKNAVVDFRESYSLQNIIQGGIYSVIATIIFIFGIILVNRGTHFTNHKLKVWTGQNQKGLNLFNTEILSPPRLASLWGK